MEVGPALRLCMMQAVADCVSRQGSAIRRCCQGQVKQADINAWQDTPWRGTRAWALFEHVRACNLVMGYEAQRHQCEKQEPLRACHALQHDTLPGCSQPLNRVSQSLQSLLERQGMSLAIPVTSSYLSLLDRMSRSQALEVSVQTKYKDCAPLRMYQAVCVYLLLPKIADTTSAASS